jgi:proline dehydrogenase
MNDDLLNQASAALRKAALNDQAKEYILSNPVLFNTLKKAADRYIGGETLEETVRKVKVENGKGFKCSIEFMGENTRTEQEANAARDEFIKICQVIKQQGLQSTVSLDLSHIGLAISRDLSLANLNLICSEASKGDIEIIISAEDAGRTDAVLQVYKDIAKVYNNVAVTLQAYLHRTKEDFEDILKLNRKIRIVKGAFETPPGLSMPRGQQLDKVYLEYVERLLSQNHPCSIATHHHEIQQGVKELIRKYNVDAKSYEFESLYGIQNEQLLKLKQEGYTAKLYFVYGKEWYLYVCNRLAEYPLNIFRALQDIVA